MHSLIITNNANFNKISLKVSDKIKIILLINNNSNNNNSIVQ